MPCNTLPFKSGTPQHCRSAPQCACTETTARLFLPCRVWLWCARAVSRCSHETDSLMLLQVGSRPIRPLSSVILPRDQIDAIVADAEQFQGSEAWYGAPWHTANPETLTLS